MIPGRHRPGVPAPRGSGWRDRRVSRSARRCGRFMSDLEQKPPSCGGSGSHKSGGSGSRRVSGLRVTCGSAPPSPRRRCFLSVPKVLVSVLCFFFFLFVPRTKVDSLAELMQQLGLLKILLFFPFRLPGSDQLPVSPPNEFLFSFLENVSSLFK